MKKIEAWLPKMDLQGSSLLVVDNASTDESWTWMKETLLPLLPKGSSVLVRNPENVGGYGSLLGNSDLYAKAEWVMTLHQDDQYASDHVTRHKAVIGSNQGSELGMVSSEAQSVSTNDKRLAFPRGVWFLGDAPSAEDIFLSHIKTHCYPFSGASFRVKMLCEITIPWHSTAFPDTEIILRACAKWKFMHLSKVTVQYLENPESESHLLDAAQRDHGAFLALVRVFRSAEFAALLSAIPQDKLEDFLIALNRGLSMRISDSRLLGLIRVIAQEAAIDFNGMNAVSSSLLSPAFEEIGDMQAASHLESGQRGSVYPSIASEAISFRYDHETVVENTRARYLKMGVARLLGLVPNKLARLIYRGLLSVPIIRKSMPQWDLGQKR